jgi:leucyl/phenylalanyl-tRNA---protein transferase
MSNSYYQLETGRVAAIDGNCQGYYQFPPLNQALSEPNGLIAIGGDLSTTRLLSAYKQGIFPWFNEGEPAMWWSPNPRMILQPNALKISKSLAKILKANHQNNTFESRINTAFQAVITACSETPRIEKTTGKHAGTWISPDMITAYCELHKQGFAVSSETWMNGKLVGGCYGVKIGRMFYGESMFHTQPNASKIAFVKLVEWLKNEGVGLIDCQMKTPLLESFGGREISRDDFMMKLSLLTTLK